MVAVRLLVRVTTVTVDMASLNKEPIPALGTEAGREAEVATIITTAADENSAANVGLMTERTKILRGDGQKIRLPHDLMFLLV